MLKPGGPNTNARKDRASRERRRREQGRRSRGEGGGGEEKEGGGEEEALERKRATVWGNEVEENEI